MNLARASVLAVALCCTGLVGADPLQPLDAGPYLMERERELALALSAGPGHVTANAEVLLFSGDGYHPVRQGGNGFVCLVERSWTNATHWKEFFEPRLSVPICYNREASQTILPVYLKKTQLALAGYNAQEIQRRLDSAFRSGEFRTPRGTAMSYMVSAGQYLGEPAGQFRPHVMLYSPYTTDADWGDNASPTDFPQLLMEAGGPHAVVVIPLPDNAFVQPSNGSTQRPGETRSH